MSKKDYQAIASAMHWNKPQTVGEAFAVWRNIVDELIPILRAGNPRFNAELFREACETGRCRGMKARS